MTATTTRKATHTGTCQICGCNQKLPNGLLSLHGYTTRWGFFEGTCNGSNHLPFEIDYSLIEAAITSAENHAKALRDRAEVERAEASPESCWFNVYTPATWETRKSSYRWHKLEIIKMKIYGLGYIHPETGKETQTGSCTNDRNELAREHANDYAKTLESKARQIDGYIEWQKERIRDWKPSELKPVK